MNAQGLAEWLSAQLDADDLEARRSSWVADPPYGVMSTVSDCDCGEDHSYDNYLAIAPAFVLADIAAKRAVLAEFAKWRQIALDDSGSLMAALRYDAWVHVLLPLAQPYRDRPGWRDEWAVAA